MNLLHACCHAVYFDNPEMHCYHTRLRKENEARVVRVRWYGQVDMGAAAAVQVAGVGLKKHLTSIMKTTTSLKQSSSLQRTLSFRQGSSSRLQPSASLERQGSAPLKKAPSKREVNVFVERKTHYESWSGLKSIKVSSCLVGEVVMLKSKLGEAACRLKCECSIYCNKHCSRRSPPILR